MASPSRRILCAIFAHPDDETFVVGGLVARLATDGGRAHLYCATDGDAGRASGVPVSSRQELAALRRAELRSAARILGFDDVRAPGHTDGALGDVDPDVLTGEIVQFLRQHRPQVVVTFGPEGGRNAHRDHRAISRAATAAYYLAGVRTAFPEQLADGLTPHTPSRLFYSAWPTPGPGDELRHESLPVNARVDVRAWNDRKRAAFLLHATQRDHQARFEKLALTDDETFALVSEQRTGMLRDLFADVDG
ncbi:MAG TPA: PIG-L family deacetylase [Gemmatimonadaceae bacterium]|nr:PIG-L family deacetylase [Gemmatimonadaceae bacterium]